MAPQQLLEHAALLTACSRAPNTAATVALTTAFLLSPPLPADDLTAVDACARARGIIEARLPETAKARWTNLLSDCPAKPQPSLESVQRAVTAWAKSEFELADALARSGDLKGQLSHLENAVALDPANLQASAALRDARRRSATLTIEQARALLGSGKNDDAIKLLNDLVARSADEETVGHLASSLRDQVAKKMLSKAAVGHYTDALNDLQTLLEASPELSVKAAAHGNRGLLWSSTRARLLAWGQYLFEILAVVLLGVWLLVRIGKRYFLRPLLVLQDFQDYDHQAVRIEQAIRAKLLNFCVSSGRANVFQNVTRPLEAMTLPVELTKAIPSNVPWLQAIPAVIPQLLPRKTRSIRGVLHRNSERGVGITIELTSGGGRESLVESFWSSQYVGDTTANSAAASSPAASGPGQPTHYELAEYVAVWLLFNLSDTKFRLLGTGHWRSYAFFLAGVRAEGRHQLMLARDFYLRALREDGNLQAARLNLALLAGAAERLLVLDLLRCAAEGAEPTDATRYHARYTLAARLYDHGERAVALQEAEGLLQEVMKVSDEFDLHLRAKSALRVAGLEPGHRTRDQATMPSSETGNIRFWSSARREKFEMLEDFLNYLVPIALTLWAGIRVSENSSDERAEKAVNEIPRTEYSLRVYFNVACMYSLLARRERLKPAGATGEKEKKYLRLALESLQHALWMSPEPGRKSPGDDPTLATLRESTVELDGKQVRTLFGEMLARYTHEAHMTSVKGAVEKSDDVSAFWLYTYKDSGNVIDLSNKEADMSPGSYELFWKFRGRANGKIKIGVTAGSNVLFGPYEDNIPPGGTEGHGETSITVP